MRVNVRHLWAYVGGHDRRIDALEDRAAQLEVGERAARLTCEYLETRLTDVAGTVANARDGRRIEALEFSSGAQAELLGELEQRCYRLGERIDDSDDAMMALSNRMGT